MFTAFEGTHPLRLHLCRALQKTVRRQGPLIDLIIDQLQAIQMVPLQLPHLSDPRALRVADALLAKPQRSSNFGATL